MFKQKKIINNKNDRQLKHKFSGSSLFSYWQHVDLHSEAHAQTHFNTRPQGCVLLVLTSPSWYANTPLSTGNVYFCEGRLCQLLGGIQEA